MRRRQGRGLAKALKKLYLRVSHGRLKKRDKILEAVGRLKERFPKAHPFVTIHVGASHREFTYAWHVAKFKDALRRDGAYLLRSNQAGWSAQGGNKDGRTVHWGDDRCGNPTFSDGRS
jgi:hypothetical protein